MLVRWCAVLFAVGLSRLAVADELRVHGLSPRPADRILVFVVRSDGVKEPVVAFQERAREILEGHTHSRVISMEEAFVRGGATFQRRLAECRGDDRCYARLVGSVDASYLLVVTASEVAGTSVVGARLIDLDAAKALGSAVDTVDDGRILEALSDRIKGALPEGMWDPFGTLRIEADVPGIEIAVNDRMVGVTPLPRIGHLLPGSYRITATRPGYAPWRGTANVQRGQEAVAGVSLEPVADGAWVWWVVAAVAVVAGGAAAAALALGSSDDPTFCSSPDPAACN